MSANRGMGRGLAAILPESGIGEPHFRDVPVGMIRPNPDQPRKRFDPDSIEVLARSLADTGVIQPLIVRPLDDGRYELIAGERRWRAAQHAGLETVPALIRDEDEIQRMQIALIENMAREDLNPVEEARACAALVEELGVSKEELGRRLGRSRVAISNLVRLLDLPDEVLALLEDGSLSEGHGRAILLRSREPASARRWRRPRPPAAGRCARPSAARRRGDPAPRSPSPTPTSSRRCARPRSGSSRRSAPASSSRRGARASAPRSTSRTSTRCWTSPSAREVR